MKATLPGSSVGRVGTALATAVVLWASAFAVIRSAAEHYPPGGMALLRFVVASVALLAYLPIGGAGFRRPPLKDIWPFLMCGLLGVTIYHTLLNYGEKVVSAGAAALLINSAPVWTTLLAVPLLGEKLTPRKSLGTFIGFVGIALVILGQRQEESGGHFHWLPALGIVGSAICTSIYVIMQKKYLSHYTALEFTCWTIWAGTLLLTPLFLYELIVALRTAPAQATLEIMYLGVFPGAIAYLTFAYATQRLLAARVMSFLYLVPPVAMLMAWAYPGLHEIPTLLSLAGGALAIGGVAIVNTGLPKREAAKPLVAVEEA